MDGKTLQYEIRRMAYDYIGEMRAAARRKSVAVDPVMRSTLSARINYADGGAAALDRVLAFMGDLDGVRMLQAEREGA